MGAGAGRCLGTRAKLTAGNGKLSDYTKGSLFRGVIVGLNEAFVITPQQRALLIATDARSAEVIKPFVQGAQLRPWQIEDGRDYLIAIRSSANREWPWSASGDEAENVFRVTYPAIHEHLTRFRDAAMKRTDQGKHWWELRSCAYWDAFDAPKIVWPDISKLPRFSMDTEDLCLGNSGYFIPGSDYYLLGVLASWATWFFISKTSQPLRLRGDRWQYRLFTQSMEHVPIPDAPAPEREAIAGSARTCGELAQSRYQGEVAVQRRLVQAFSADETGRLNEKAQAWWELPLNPLGDALKQSFKLPGNPLKNPRIADEWEPYLKERRDKHARLTRALAAAEAELNDRVYRLFDLTPDEIKLLQREVEH